jgi:hypothetical protein
VRQGDGRGAREGRLLRSAFTPPHMKVRLHRLIMQAFDCLSMVVVRKASAGRMTEWAPVARANILDHILSIGIALDSRRPLRLDKGDVAKRLSRGLSLKTDWVPF